MASEISSIVISDKQLLERVHSVVQNDIQKVLDEHDHCLVVIRGDKYTLMRTGDVLDRPDLHAKAMKQTHTQCVFIVMDPDKPVRFLLGQWSCPCGETSLPSTTNSRMIEDPPNMI